MRQGFRFVCLSALVLFSTVAIFAESPTSAVPASPVPMTGSTDESAVQPATQSAIHESPTDWFESFVWNRVTHFFLSLIPAEPDQKVPVAEKVSSGPPPVSPFEAQPGCAVTPLEAIEAPSAKELEASDSPGGAIDTKDMIPAAAHALDLFQSKVSSAGGSLVLHSAYRPEAYQRHLQDVWYKWMGLKSNSAPACQGLRTAVQAEFLHHHLLESQHPVAVSDHTRGLAFDATVDLPKNAKIGRRKATLDLLARLAGLIRPAIVADPVHFKFLGGMPRVQILASARRAPRRRLVAARRIHIG